MPITQRYEFNNKPSGSELDALGLWKTSGNVLTGGGGDKLGSKDNQEWFLIANNIGIGGIQANGNFFLANGHIADTNSRWQFTTEKITTANAALTALFTLLQPIETIYRWNLKVAYKDDSSAIWGVLEKSFSSHRALVAPTLGKIQSDFTDRQGSLLPDLQISVSGSNIVMNVQGIAATNMQWCATLSFQGNQF